MWQTHNYSVFKQVGGMQTGDRNKWTSMTEFQETNTVNHSIRIYKQLTTPKLILKKIYDFFFDIYSIYFVY